MPNPTIPQLPYPQGAVAAAQNPGLTPVAGITPQAQPAPTPNPLQALAGQGQPQEGIPQGGELAQLQQLFAKMNDPQERLKLATLLGQTHPAPTMEELDAQLASFQGGG